MAFLGVKGIISTGI